MSEEIKKEKTSKNKKILYAMYHTNMYDNEIHYSKEIDINEFPKIFLAFLKNATYSYLKDTTPDFTYDKKIFKDQMVAIFLSFILKNRRPVNIFKHENYEEIAKKEYSESTCEFIKLVERDGYITTNFSRSVFHKDSILIRTFIRTMMVDLQKQYKDKLEEEDYLINFSVIFLNYLEDIYKETNYFDLIATDISNDKKHETEEKN